MSEKSCFSCPSFLTPTESVGFFGKSVGAPICARLGIILAKPNATDAEAKRTADMTAQSCADWKKPRPTAPPAVVARVVTLPDPEARNELADLDRMKVQVRTCAQCVNFVPDEKVVSQLGFTAGLCRAKGTLIPPNGRISSARGCGFRSFGSNVDNTTEGLLMLPVLDDPSHPTVIDDFLAGVGELAEPRDYVSDLPVSVADQEQGIKAWRKITDPDGYGEDVFLPIFDPASFTLEELEAIPKTGDDNSPELYLDHGARIYQVAALWMELDEVPALLGEPGVGKSEFCYHMAWLLQIPFYRFPINEATELDELAGRKEYTPEIGTHFVEGRLTQAWPRRSVILIDEPNTGRNEIWTFLRPLLDGTRTLTLDVDKGQKVKRGDYTYLALAFNPAWDPRNVGTAQIGAADVSRLMHLEFSMPPAHIERQIITNRVAKDGWVIDKPRLDFVMKVNELLRALCDDGTLGITWSVRESIKVARALRWFGPLHAYSVAGGDFLEPAQREVFLDQVRACLPNGKFPPIKEVVKK